MEVAFYIPWAFKWKLPELQPVQKHKEKVLCNAEQQIPGGPSYHAVLSVEHKLF